MFMDEIFSRNVQGMTDCLASAKVGIAGCGGLGSNVAVALVSLRHKKACVGRYG
jgi:molybdopterin/thiamine biosynthesis adenylyltransferase